LLALLLLIRSYEHGSAEQRAQVFDLYLKQRHQVNNWDLVDVSAPKILGPHIYDADGVTAPGRNLLTTLARSKSVWDRRIAIITTQHFIRHRDFAETLRLAELLLTDQHDLLHKAVGWMLREVGKRDRAVEESFLRQHAAHMPRTMLRYAIEKLPPARRADYLRITRE
jgi:3-methyladenine DNA glycosylase AlkD